MQFPNRVFFREIRDAARDPLYALVGACRQCQFVGCLVQQFPAFSGGSKRLLEGAADQFRIANAGTFELD
jgi:hypothetical protein